MNLENLLSHSTILKEKFTEHVQWERKKKKVSAFSLVLVVHMARFAVCLH